MHVWLAGFNELYLVFCLAEEVLWVSRRSTRVADGSRLKGAPPQEKSSWVLDLSQRLETFGSFSV